MLYPFSAKEYQAKDDIGERFANFIDF